MKLLLFLVLMSPSALANSFDEDARRLLKWEDTRTPGKISDYGVATLIVTSIATPKTWEQRGGVALAHVVGAATNFVVKKTVGRLRPDGSEHVSFYSGHTSEAFLSAGAICIHSNTEICVASLLAASGVGYLRIAADKHWATDVIVGAGVGYACGRYIPTLIVRF